MSKNLFLCFKHQLHVRLVCIYYHKNILPASNIGLQQMAEDLYGTFKYWNYNNWHSECMQ